MCVHLWVTLCMCENPRRPKEAIAQETSQTQRTDDWAGRLFLKLMCAVHMPVLIDRLMCD